MYWVAGFPLLPVQNVSVRVASGASRPSVACTVAPSGTWAIAALIAATCVPVRYVWACQMLLIGNWNASATAMAAIIAAPCRAAPARADCQRAAAGAGPGPGSGAGDGPARQRANTSTAAMNMIGIAVAL